MHSNPTIRKIVGWYSGFQFFFSLQIWVPIFYEYQKKMGLSDIQIFSIQSIYYFFFCFLEIPTGFIADRYGRLQCLRWGAILLTLSNILPIFWVNYTGFITHFILLALARSLVSGASSAYLYDYLQVCEKVGQFKEIEGRARAYGLAGKVVCWSVVGFLMHWITSLPYWLSSLTSVISILFVWKLPKEIAVNGPSNDLPRFEKFLIDFQSVFGLLIQSPSILLVMFQGISAFVLARICQVNLFQPILEVKLFKLSSFGIIMSMMTVFEALGSANPHWLKRWAGDLHWVSILTLASALSLTLVAKSGQLGTLVGLGLFALATGLCFPIQRQLMNDCIQGAQYRATFLSLESLLDRAICAYVASILSGFVTHGKIPIFLEWSAGISCVGIVVLHIAVRILLHNSMSLTKRDTLQSCNS